jgi:hypothetical protein
MPVQSLEYKQHSLLPTQRGGQWTVLIRQPDQVLCHPRVAKADNYSEAIWQAQRIVDDISTPVAAHS